MIGSREMHCFIDSLFKMCAAGIGKVVVLVFVILTLPVSHQRCTVDGVLLSATYDTLEIRSGLSYLPASEEGGYN
jgi:hypothetical protein